MGAGNRISLIACKHDDVVQYELGAFWKTIGVISDVCGVCISFILWEEQSGKPGRTGRSSLCLPGSVDVCSISPWKCGELSVCVKSTVKEQTVKVTGQGWGGIRL